MDDASAELVARWQAGDQAAAEELFRRYAEHLISVARIRLSSRLAQRVNAEDVVQSVYRSFFVHARAGRYCFQRAGDLWRLLVAITLHKLRSQVERHTRGKRDINLEHGQLHIPLDVIAREPSPLEAAALTDELERVMTRLDPLYRRILELRLQGYNVAEISTAVERSVRTVKRGLHEIREQLSQSNDRV